MVRIASMTAFVCTVFAVSAFAAPTSGSTSQAASSGAIDTRAKATLFLLSKTHKAAYQKWSELVYDYNIASASERAFMKKDVERARVRLQKINEKVIIQRMKEASRRYKVMKFEYDEAPAVEQELLWKAYDNSWQDYLRAASRLQRLRAVKSASKASSTSSSSSSTTTTTETSKSD